MIFQTGFDFSKSVNPICIASTNYIHIKCQVNKHFVSMLHKSLRKQKMKKRCSHFSFKNKKSGREEKYTNMKIHFHIEIMKDTRSCFNIKYLPFEFVENCYRNSQLQSGREEKMMQAALKKKKNLVVLIELLGLDQKAHTSFILTGSLLARELLMASYRILNT